MDLQNLQTFLQVASFESFTKAAEELNYAQSTVTVQIQQLEKELGFPLFERIGRKNHLTLAGTEFLSYANQILQILQKASTITADDRDIVGVIRLGVLQSLMLGDVSKLIPTFRDAYPNVNIQVYVGPAAELLSMLKQNQLDILYVSSDLIDDPMLKVCYRRTEEIDFIANANHPLANKRGIPLQEVFSYPFVSTEATGYSYRKLHELAAICNITVRHPIISNEISAINSFLSSENNLTFLATCAVHDKLDAGELVCLDVDCPPTYYYSQIIYHKNKWITPYIQFFISLIKNCRSEQ